MDLKDIEAYKKEMLKLYNKGKPAMQAEKYVEITEAEEKMAEKFTAQKENTVPENISAEQEKSENEEYDDKDYADAEHDTSYYPYTEDDEDAELERIVSSTDLPEFELPYEPELISDAGLGDSTGFILVNVRTGREATPVVGASVVVTAISNGSRLLAAAGITDISGTVLRFEVPAPDKAYSQTPDTEVRPYSLFDISVRAKGFFNARSVDVPVFSGITSIQNFNMVPLPIAADSSEDTLTYFNQEPF